MRTTERLKLDHQRSWRMTAILAGLLAALVLPTSTTAQWLDSGMTWTNSGSNTTYTQDNVGIGTSAPNAKLEVSNGNVRISNTGGSRLEFFESATDRGFVGWQASSPLGVYLWNRDNSPIYFGTTNLERMRITDTGYVGIGTVSPQAKLDVHGSLTNATDGTGWGLKVRDQSAMAAGVGGGILFQGNKSASGAAGNFAAIEGAKENATDFNEAGQLLFYTTPQTTQLLTERMRIDSLGNVGIGTTNLSAKLSIDGSIDFVNTVGARLMVTANNDMSFGTNNSEKMRITPGGNVGIGTSAPAAKLDVNGGITLVNDLRFTLDGTIQIANATQPLRFFMNGVEKMRLEQNGSVGVGMTCSGPAGSLCVAGNIAAKYQDVAEWVPALGPLPVGTVVVLDSEHSNRVLPSSAAYDTRVAGVITETPGILLGEGGEGKVKVATTGRVKVKVDASKGAIGVGDLLVTSGKEGVAMRSEPLDLGGTPIHRPGTLIGKALEPLSSGNGEILVLLSLQ